MPVFMNITYYFVEALANNSELNEEVNNLDD